MDRLRHRFHIGRVRVVADRGMISAATIAALEERKLEYILGARERNSAVIRNEVLSDEAPFAPLLIERASGETQLFAAQYARAGRIASFQPKISRNVVLTAAGAGITY